MASKPRSLKVRRRRATRSPCSSRENGKVGLPENAIFSLAAPAAPSRSTCRRPGRYEAVHGPSTVGEALQARIGPTVPLTLPQPCRRITGPSAENPFRSSEQADRNAMRDRRTGLRWVGAAATPWAVAAGLLVSFTAAAGHDPGGGVSVAPFGRLDGALVPATRLLARRAPALRLSPR